MKRTIFWILMAALFIIAQFLIFAPVFGGNQTTSSTIASSIIDQARKYLHDPTTHGGTQKSIWSDTEMLQWVNDGSLDIVARTHCLEDTEVETLVAGQRDYPLSDPFIVINYVLYTSSGSSEIFALKEGALSEIGRTASSEGATPTHWAQWENNVVVFPAPDSTTAGGTITAHVVDRPVDVASGAAVLVPAQFDKALVYYVAAQGWAKDGRSDMAAAYMTLYMQELDRFRQDFSQQIPQE